MILVRRFVAIKENIQLSGKQDLQTKVMITMFGLFAEIERNLISERTKEGVAAAKAKGRLLGRPKGVLGKSKLDGREEEIRLLLSKKVSKYPHTRSVLRESSFSISNPYRILPELLCRFNHGNVILRGNLVVNDVTRAHNMAAPGTGCLNGLLHHTSNLVRSAERQ